MHPSACCNGTTRQGYKWVWFGGIVCSAAIRWGWHFLSHLEYYLPPLLLEEEDRPPSLSFYPVRQGTNILRDIQNYSKKLEPRSLRDLVSITKNNFPFEFDNASTPTGRMYALCNHILAILYFMLQDKDVCLLLE